MSFADLERGGDSITIALVIDGLADAFYSGPVAPTFLAGRMFRPGVQRMTPVRAGLEGAVLTASECTVTLCPDGVDYVSQLLRLSPSGATRFLTLAVTLPRSLATGGTLTTNEANTAWPSSGHLWIGRECIAYSAKPTSTTFTVSGRGVYGSEVQRHVADLAVGQAPRLYSECCTWKGRRARVFVQARDRYGLLVGSPLCEVDGVIEGLPHASGTTGEVDVLVRAWAGRLDRTFGGDEMATGLQPGWHLFDGQVGHDLSHVSQGWPENRAWRTSVRSAFALGATSIDVVDADPYDARFDPAKTADQRSGLIRFTLDPTPLAGVYRVTASGAGPTITIDPPTEFAGAIGNRILSIEVAYALGAATVLASPGVAEVVGWPGTALRRLQPLINSRDITAANGLWASLAIQSNGSDGAVLRVSRNDGPLDPSDSAVFLAVDLGLVQGGPGLPGLCFGTDLPAHIAPEGRAAAAWTLPGWRFIDRADALRAEGVQLDPGSNRVLVTDAQGTGALTPASLPLRIPTAYYAVGERYILSTNNPAGSPSAAAPVTLLAETTWGGQRVRRTIRIIGAVQASTITAGAPGWALEVHPADRVTGYPLTDDGVSEPTTLRPVLAAEAVTPTAFMLQLLLSGDGDGFNSATYDVLPFGADLPESAVDVASFESYPLPGAPLGLRSILLQDEETVSDLLKALAMSVAGVITERVCREAGPLLGRRRLALVPMQVPIQGNAVRLVALGDVLEGRLPSSETDEALTNQITIKARAKTRNGLAETKAEVRIIDRDSTQEHGASAPEVLDAVGVRFTAQSPEQHRALLETYAQKRFYLRGGPVRVVVAGVDYGTVATLSPGDTVVLGAGMALDFSGVKTTTTGLLRVTEVTRDAILGEGEVRGEFYGAVFKGAGWAPEMRVASVDSATVVTVEANAYSDPVHPILGTPQTDAGFFAPGDEVLCFERTSANPWPGVTRTIVSVVGNVITLNAAHGIAAAGGRLRPSTFAGHSAALASFAYLTAAPPQVYA